MQRYLYREIGAARRPELHTQVALALEDRQQTGRLPAAEIASHWLAAGGSTRGHALEWAVQAGDEAVAKLAPDEARRWYEVALDLVDRGPDVDEPERCELLIKRGEAERQGGEPKFRSTLLEAAELAQVIGDPERLVRAALANSRGMQSETGIVDEARIAVLDAAIASVGDGVGPSRARLLAMRAAELMYSRGWVQRVRLSDEALTVARELGDPRALSTVLNLRFVTLLAPETHSERSANAIEAVAAAESLGDPMAQFYAYHWRGYACIEAGDVAGARSWATREREIAERFRQPTSLWLACAQEANLAIIAGDLELASQLADRALQLGRHSEPDALACHAAQQISIAFESRCLPELVPRIQAAVVANPGVPGFRAALALALAEASRQEEAQILLNETTASGYRDVAYDVAWLAVTCIHGYVSAELGDAATAARLYELLKPWHAQIAFPAFGVWGPVEFYLGRLAREIGAGADAESHLSAAAQIASRADAALWQDRIAGELTRLAGVRS